MQPFGPLGFAPTSLSGSFWCRNRKPGGAVRFWILDCRSSVPVCCLPSTGPSLSLFYFATGLGCFASRPLVRFFSPTAGPLAERAGYVARLLRKREGWLRSGKAAGKRLIGRIVLYTAKMNRHRASRRNPLGTQTYLCSISRWLGQFTSTTAGAPHRGRRED